jgi:hypothetical protein
LGIVDASLKMYSYMFTSGMIFRPNGCFGYSEALDKELRGKPKPKTKPKPKKKPKSKLKTLRVVSPLLAELHPKTINDVAKALKKLRRPMYRKLEHIDVTPRTMGTMGLLLEAVFTPGKSAMRSGTVHPLEELMSPVLSVMCSNAYQGIDSTFLVSIPYIDSWYLRSMAGPFFYFGDSTMATNQYSHLTLDKLLSTAGQWKHIHLMGVDLRDKAAEKLTAAIRNSTGLKSVSLVNCNYCDIHCRYGNASAYIVSAIAARPFLDLNIDAKLFNVLNREPTWRANIVRAEMIWKDKMRFVKLLNKRSTSKVLYLLSAELVHIIGNQHVWLPRMFCRVCARWVPANAVMPDHECCCAETCCA